MPRFSQALLAALIATPALALEEGTYPVLTPTGGGEITVSDRWLSITLTGSGSCEAVAEGRVLRGETGDWAAVFETGAEPCVLVGTAKEFVPVGGSCAALGSGGCELRGQLGVVQAAPSEPVQVITAILRGRFGALGEAERRAVQSLLAERGFYVGEVDGAYGPATEAALVAQLQSMADAGEVVDGNSTRFIQELMEAMAGEGAPLAAEVTSAAPSGAPVYAGTWNCGGFTVRLSEDRYAFLNPQNGSVVREGRLRPDSVEGRTAYLELVGYGNLAFFDVGRPGMVVSEPSIGEIWDCRPG